MQIIAVKTINEVTLSREQINQAITEYVMRNVPGAKVNSSSVDFKSRGRSSELITGCTLIAEIK